MKEEFLKFECLRCGQKWIEHDFPVDRMAAAPVTYSRPRPRPEPISGLVTGVKAFTEEQRLQTESLTGVVCHLPKKHHSNQQYNDQSNFTLSSLFVSPGFNQKRDNLRMLFIR